MPEPIEQVLTRAFSQNLEGPAGRDNIRENLGGLAVLHLHLKEGVEMNWKVVAERLIWDFAYTLRINDEQARRLTELESQLAAARQELAEQEVEKMGLIKSMQKAARRIKQGVQKMIQDGRLTKWEFEDALLELTAPAAPTLVGDETPPKRITCIHDGCLNEHVHDGHCACYLLGASDEAERHESPEIIGFYETSGLPVREGDDYVTDVEGCYLTRAEAEALAEDDAAAASLVGEKGPAA